VKRLAMQVEDHPIDYNTFEGTIPKGEYGGGTVMLWDRGTYSSDSAASPDEEEDALRDGLRRGDLKITFHGDRLHGSFALVRMKYSRDSSSSAKPQWLLIKHRDEFATEEDVVAENMTSVDTGRTMEEIAAGKSRVWHSNREPKAKALFATTRVPSARATRKSSAESEDVSSSAISAASLEPMYASIGSDVPDGGWTFEPKYDGVRVLAYATSSDVKLITRNGKDKAKQFPEIVESLRKLAAQAKRTFVLDGEKAEPLVEVQGRVKFFHVDGQRLACSACLRLQFEQQPCANSRAAMRGQQGDVHNADFPFPARDEEPARGHAGALDNRILRTVIVRPVMRGLRCKLLPAKSRLLRVGPIRHRQFFRPGAGVDGAKEIGIRFGRQPQGDRGSCFHVWPLCAFRHLRSRREHALQREAEG